MPKVVNVEVQQIKGADHIVVTLGDERQIMNNWPKGFAERGRRAKSLIGKEVEWNTWDEHRFPHNEWFDDIWEVKTP